MAWVIRCSAAISNQRPASNFFIMTTVPPPAKSGSNASSIVLE